MTGKPIAIDLYCGLGGWTNGLLAEGYDVIGFDIERHAYGEDRYPAQLVLQDVRTIHGSQFRNAALIVASSPCQEFSWRAMPWKAAKAAPPPFFGMELFAQAARIQREAIEAAGHFIPMVQENVRGAQKYVGRARWHYGSYYLWGDVPALMPIVSRQGAMKVGDVGWRRDNGIASVGFNVMAARQLKDDSVKIGGARGDDWFTHHNREEFNDRATKNDGGSWFNVAHNTTSGVNNNPARGASVGEGVKQGGDWFNAASLDGNGLQSISRRSSSKSSARKEASARIAKIPLPLARHIARAYYPNELHRLLDQQP